MTRSHDDEQLPLSRTPPVDEDVRREIAFHLEERAAELERQGVPRDRARAIARDSFGDRTAFEEECRTIEQRRRTSAKRSDRLGALLQDIRIGTRVLRKSPGFTLAAIVTLALGIGATAAVFSIVNRLVLQPLPYHEPDRIVSFTERHANNRWGNVPWSTLLDIRRESRAFDGIAAYSSGTTTALTSAGAMRVQAGWISEDFFKVIPARPELGRLPRADEHVHGAPPVALVSHAFWRDVLGAPAKLDGIRIRLGLEHEVIGVMPATFNFPDGNQIWRPIELLDQSMSHTSHNWPVIGRLASGVSRAAAEREIDGIFTQLRPRYFPDWDALGSIVTLYQESVSGPMKTPLYLLLGASAILLLAACTNLASAMLARGTARASEFALRSALGATRLRLVRQLLTESTLLALVGCGAGLLLAALMLRALAPLAPANLIMDRVRVDGWVQGFALIVALTTTVMFGLFPALRLTELNTTLALREGGGGGGGGTAGTRRMRAWHGLVAAEVALAVTLFAGSALLIRSFANVMKTDIGFDPNGAVMVSIDLPPINYDNASLRVTSFHERALEALRRIPHVRAAGLVNVMPLGGSFPNGAMEVEGKPHNPRGAFTGFSVYRVISRGYFDALGGRIIEGRDFGLGDDLGGNRVVIVSEAFAKQEWPGQSALGKRVRPAGMDGLDEPWFTVVGVASDARLTTVTAAYVPVYYFDSRQRPPNRARSVTYVLRTDGTGAISMPAVTAAIKGVDPEVPIAAQPVNDLVSAAVSARRFTMLVLGTFAATALLLAAVGIYGVVSYAVAQRTREIGVRRALGATPVGVQRLIIGSSMRAVIPGLVAGGLLSLATAQALRSLLYGVSPFDAAALAAAIVVLGVAGLVASVIPAVRATRIDPMVAMRSE